MGEQGFRLTIHRKRIMDNSKRISLWKDSSKYVIVTLCGNKDAMMH
jgi:hypothetical protein